MGAGSGVPFPLVEPHKGPRGQECGPGHRARRASLLAPSQAGSIPTTESSPAALRTGPASTQLRTGGGSCWLLPRQGWVVSRRDPPATLPSPSAQPGDARPPPALALSMGPQQKVLLTSKHVSSVFYLIFNFYFLLIFSKNCKTDQILLGISP